MASQPDPPGEREPPAWTGPLILGLMVLVVILIVALFF
jgi:hypothetical protein